MGAEFSFKTKIIIKKSYPLTFFLINNNKIIYYNNTKKHLIQISTSINESHRSNITNNTTFTSSDQ